MMEEMELGVMEVLEGLQKVFGNGGDVVFTSRFFLNVSILHA